MLVLAAPWLGMAWVVPAGLPAGSVEAARTARVVGAALCWMAVRSLPLAVGPGSAIALPALSPRPWLNLILRRMVWFAALVGAALWWHG